MELKFRLSAEYETELYINVEGYVMLKQITPNNGEQTVLLSPKQALLIAPEMECLVNEHERLLAEELEAQANE